MNQQSTVEHLIEDEGDDSVAPLHLIPKINLVPHTVFLLCGPTCSGKSTFSEDLALLADNNNLSFVHLSSDEIRKELLSASALSPLVVTAESKSDRYSPAMGAVARQAFSILENKYENAISFPVNTEIIVIDTTGMDSGFRNGIRSKGQAHGYKVVLVTFEYKKRSEYFPEGLSQEHKDIVESSVIRFRRKILPDLKAREFDNRLTIKSKAAFGWQLVREDSWWFEDSINDWMDNAVSDMAKEKLLVLEESRDLGVDLDQEPPVYVVIGDSHECTKELEILIKLAEDKYPGSRIVHVGDYLDKGGDTANMINFMHERMKKGDIIVVGNHENYVYKRLKAQIEPNLDLERDHFTSVSVLESDAGLVKKFFQLFEASLPFAILCDYDYDGGIPVYVTHAPCEKKHLGKVHDLSLLAQRNYRFKDRNVNVFKDLQWLYDEAEINHPLHIFGHVSYITPKGKRPKLAYKNKVFLDTAAVYGGSLSAVVVTGGRIIDTLQVECEKRREAELPGNLASGPRQEVKFNILDYDLDPRDYRLLDSVMANGVKYISGTMAPAPSSNTEIEPLEGALEWFKKAGATSVAIQPKYMGSRAQLYLFDNKPEKTFLVSRGGWVIKNINGLDELDFTIFKLDLYNKYRHLTEEMGDMVIDGELMPWSALGKGLIETHFHPYSALVHNELNELDADEGLAKLVEFKNKLDIAGKKAHIQKFDASLSNYSGDTKPEFKPFKILSASKEEFLDVAVFDDNFGYSLLHDGLPPLVVSLKDEDMVASREIAAKLFQIFTEDLKMEGVVVKPLDGECDIPYMKVRSEEYLRLVYGYDYTDPNRYSRLCRQKNISGKVRVSVAEHKLATAMLNAEGDQKKMLIVKMIGQMKTEQSLDPRL